MMLPLRLYFQMFHWRMEVVIRRLTEEEGKVLKREDDEEFRRWFLNSGMQYYVSGRLAARAGQVQVHSNLLHHAVERNLKAALVRAATPKEMKKWGHHLPTLWKKFKARYKNPALNRFDATISALHKFEAIRYPEKLVTEGMFGAITWAPRPATKALGPGPYPPRYEDQRG